MERRVTVSPKISPRHCSRMTRRAPLIRICTRTASFSTQLLIQLRTAGRHFKISGCCAPENLWRIFITTNCLANCADSVIKYAIVRGAILRSRAFPKNSVVGFPNATGKLMKHWQNCWPTNRNLPAQTSKTCGNVWLRRNAHGNKKI
jgi:hypothetical protein